jgi:RNA polymerase sigma-70 factor (ECF subfamily)
MTAPLTEPTRATSSSSSHLRLVGKEADASTESGLDFEGLYRSHAGYVATVGFRLLGNDAELDDLVQEVFIEAHRGLSQLRDEGAVHSWLSRICVRRCVRRLRRRRLRQLLSLDDEQAPLVMDASLTPEQLSDVQRAYRVLGRFPAAERVVWILRHIEGESLERMAQICDCSKSTVQRRLRASEARFEREVSR